jgi:class III poly(R)-hydroxyalkanoic acid synthase PhaE subunit
MSDRAELKATHDLFDLWLKAYEATYGRLLDVPEMGPTRESSEKYRRHIETSVNLATTWWQSLASFQTVFMEATRKMRDQVESLAAEGKEPLANSRDLYDLWMQTYSDTFKDFMKSKYFSEDLSQLTSSSMDYERSSRELVEQNVLKPLNLPTRKEIDEINREVYLLKKQVKSLNKRLDVDAGKT